MTTDEGWARPELLCSTDWLAEHIDDEDLVLLDCDLLPAYQRLHSISSGCRRWSPRYARSSRPRSCAQCWPISESRPTSA